MCNFKVGQKVVCVALPNSRSEDVISMPEPQIGDVVTVNYIKNDNGLIYLGFEEMHQDSEFISHLFRPLQSSYTESEIEEVDISILTEELELTPQQYNHR